MTFQTISMDSGSGDSWYFSSAYGKALATQESGAEWLNFTNNDGTWQLPLILEPLDDGYFHASSPYGYSGIFIQEGLSKAVSLEHWQSALKELKERSVVSLFLRFSPFDQSSSNLAAALPGLLLRHVSDTRIVPTEDLTQMWDSMEGRARTAIRKAERSGLNGHVSPAGLADLTAGSPYRILYEATMQRIGATRNHFYTEEYYRSVAERAGSLRIATVTNESSKPAAASLILLDKDIVHYHLSGSDPEEARNGANNLLIWTIMKWSAANGYRAVHLGGGTSRGDSLYKFKSSFGGESLPFIVGSVVVDSDRYEELTRIQAANLGVTVDALQSTAYFPAFRGTVEPT